MEYKSNNGVDPSCWIEPCEEECWYCDGKGYLPNEGDADCPYCNGTGYIQIEDTDGDDYPCTTCPEQGNCDGWDAQVCPTLMNYLGIDDYDPWDV